MLGTFKKRVDDSRPLRVGELVEIRSLPEIIATLDDEGRLDGMPFMPEMVAYCGQRATVVKRAHKTCDGHGHIRWLEDAVHLEGLHCNGSAHGGCQARCLMYWKNAWLKRVTDGDVAKCAQKPSADVGFLGHLGRTTRVASDGVVRYMCQATEVNTFTRPLAVGELKQYFWDVSSGNYSLWAFTRIMAEAIFNRYQRVSTEHLPRTLLVRGGRRLRQVRGRGVHTPKETLDLKMGERVRIRSHRDIEATLNHHNTNRGLLFDAEDATWCGSSSTVIDRIQRFIDDETGQMIEIKSDCILLDGVGCRGEYWRMCSRGLPTYWREIWLERLSD